MSNTDSRSLEGTDVVAPDDHKIGTVVAERDGCVIVESGHVFHSHHAIPLDFLHKEDGVLRSTVTKEVVSDSPKVDLENWDAMPIRVHYGLEGTVVAEDAVEDAVGFGVRDPNAVSSSYDDVRIENSDSADPGWMPSGLGSGGTPHSEDFE